MNQQNKSNTLKMTFDPNTIEHLGARMYSTLPPVIAELIANSYDANASRVKIHLKDTSEKKHIIITDNGTGMSFNDINEKFLRIGRNRRESEPESTTNGRKVIGKKGLGKLSFFGVSHEIKITTTKDGYKNIFSMKWEDIKRFGKTNTMADYSPEVLGYNLKTDDKDGTEIILLDMQRESEFDAESLANHISRIFIVDTDFKIILQHNSDSEINIDNERRYAGLAKEVVWNIPNDIKTNNDYLQTKQIKGQLIATITPISPKTNMRGITLFSRKKLVNLPEYFSDSTSSHFFSYLTGWLEVDFIDDLPIDVIGTNRQSLNWDHPEMQELRNQLQKLLRWLEKDWRDQRARIRNAKIKKATGINVSDWFSKLPTDVRQKVKPIILSLTKDSELQQETVNTAVANFHTLVPEYPKYHWRYLHPEIQSVSKSYYDKEEYYFAFLESAKKYISAVRIKSASNVKDDSPMMEKVFNMSNPILSVTDNFKKPDGSDFSSDTIQNIKNAHARFSTGVVLGGRNVVAHEEVENLRLSGLFTEEDCLDALSLLSHLYRRLDHSLKAP